MCDFRVPFLCYLAYILRIICSVNFYISTCTFNIVLPVDSISCELLSIVFTLIDDVALNNTPQSCFSPCLSLSNGAFIMTIAKRNISVLIAPLLRVHLPVESRFSKRVQASMRFNNSGYSFSQDSYRAFLST